VNINGHVRVEADWLQQGDDPNYKGNATQNFWRAAENLSVTLPAGQIERWAVAQAAPYRRMHLRGQVQLWDGNIGWASGGLFADSRIGGLVVNGGNVTMHGLFVEHYQEYEVIWNGNGGRTYFFQNERPYDPPNTSWSSGAGNVGWAANKVGSNVTSHEAWGLGSYCYFNVNPSIAATRSFEVPNTAGVRFHGLVTVSLGGVGTINRIIDNSGETANLANQVRYLPDYP
jgi:hypothetical protein